jgi:hypothetical protein
MLAGITMAAAMAIPIRAQDETTEVSRAKAVARQVEADYKARLDAADQERKSTEMRWRELEAESRRHPDDRLVLIALQAITVRKHSAAAKFEFTLGLRAEASSAAVASVAAGWAQRIPDDERKAAKRRLDELISLTNSEIAALQQEVSTNPTAAPRLKLAQDTLADLLIEEQELTEMVGLEEKALQKASTEAQAFTTMSNGFKDEARSHYTKSLAFQMHAVKALIELRTANQTRRAGEILDAFRKLMSPMDSAPLPASAAGVSPVPPTPAPGARVVMGGNQ